jgi:hypothetical protein
MYIYISSEDDLWTVGFYEPKTNEWMPESDYTDKEEAAERTAWLNGSSRRHFNE